MSLLDAISSLPTIFQPEREPGRTPGYRRMTSARFQMIFRQGLFGGVGGEVGSGMQALIAADSQLELELSRKISDVLRIEEKECEGGESLLQRELPYSERSFAGHEIEIVCECDMAISGDPSHDHRVSGARSAEGRPVNCGVAILRERNNPVRRKIQIDHDRQAAQRTHAEILKAYPYLEPQDIDESLEYAAWRLGDSHPL